MTGHRSEIDVPSGSSKTHPVGAELRRSGPGLGLIPDNPSPSTNLTVLVLGSEHNDVRKIAESVSARFVHDNDQAASGAQPNNANEQLARINERVAFRLGLKAGATIISERSLVDESDVLPYAAAVRLIRAKRGRGRIAILSAAEISFLAPFWREAAARDGSDVAVILVASPACACGDAAQLIEWLRRTLAAERTTRHLNRRITLPNDDERAGAWIAATWEMDERDTHRRSPAVARGDALVEDIVPLGFNSWIRRCEMALRQLALKEGEDSYRELDVIQANLDAALAIFTPILSERRIEAMRLETGNRLLLAERDEQRDGVGDRDWFALSDERRSQIVELSNIRDGAALLQSRCDQASESEAQVRSLYLESRTLLGRSMIANVRMQHALVARVERQLGLSNRVMSRWSKRLGWNHKAARRIERHALIVERFLDDLPWTIIRVHPEGRRQRILAYLAGATDFLTDFPLVQNLEYLEMYPDVAASGMMPLVHFIVHGQGEMRNPHPLFDTHFYLAQCPQAVHLAASPVVHFLKWGIEKAYDPHPLLNTRAYWQRYADVGLTSFNPLLHWIAHPRCTVDILFDPGFYLGAYPDVAEAGRNPLTHYLGVGWHEGRNPNPWFDTRFYLANTPGLAENETNPLVHYAQNGWRERQTPGPLFDPIYYLANDPGLNDACDPLRHYIEHGRAEGRHTMSNEPVPLSVALQAGQPLRIALMIDALYPRPDQDSGSLDQVNFVRIFQQLGYEVHFLSLLEFGRDHDDRSSHYRAMLRTMGVHCVTNVDHAYFESYYFEESDRIDLCFASRVHFGGLQIESLRQLCPDARIIFNTVDLHFVREEREGALKNEPGLILQARHTRDLELTAVKQADATILVSSSEKVLLDELIPDANTFVVPLIRQFTEPHRGNFRNRRGVAFIGGFNHQPNIDAIEHFLADIWPLVYDRRPDIAFRVIGANMPEEWEHRQVPGASFIGFVEDLDTELARLRLTVAPLRYGAGAKGKLVSSLAAGVPAVVSTIASEGMGLLDGDTILVAEMGRVFADRIIELHDDEALWTKLSTNGAAFIRRNYSIDTGLDLMRDILNRMGLTWPNQRSMPDRTRQANG